MQLGRYLRRGTGKRQKTVSQAGLAAHPGDVGCGLEMHLQPFLMMTLPLDRSGSQLTFRIEWLHRTLAHLVPPSFFLIRCHSQRVELQASSGFGVSYMWMILGVFICLAIALLWFLAAQYTSSQVPVGEPADLPTRPKRDCWRAVPLILFALALLMLGGLIALPHLIQISG